MIIDYYGPIGPSLFVDSKQLFVDYFYAIVIIEII